MKGAPDGDGLTCTDWCCSWNPSVHLLYKYLCWMFDRYPLESSSLILSYWFFLFISLWESRGSDGQRALIRMVCFCSGLWSNGEPGAWSCRLQLEPRLFRSASSLSGSRLRGDSWCQFRGATRPPKNNLLAFKITPFVAACFNLRITGELVKASNLNIFAYSHDDDCKDSLSKLFNNYLQKLHKRDDSVHKKYTTTTNNWEFLLIFGCSWIWLG